MDKSMVEYFKCHKFGYKSKCQTNLNRSGGEKSNSTGKKEEVSLLMACHMNKKNEKGKFEFERANIGSWICSWKERRCF